MVPFRTIVILARQRHPVRARRFPDGVYVGTVLHHEVARHDQVRPRQMVHNVGIREEFD